MQTEASGIEPPCGQTAFGERINLAPFLNVNVERNPIFSHNMS